MTNKMGEESFKNTSCTPFVSEYSDCTGAEHCSSCSRCKCDAKGQWQCEEVFSCPLADNEPAADEDTVVTAIADMQQYLEMKNKEKKPRRFVPPPPKDEDELIVPEQNPYEEKFETWFLRQKRSLKENSGEKNNMTATVKFFHTVDEINKDTLKNSNKTGTIEAQKVPVKRIPKISRRTDLLDNFNKSAQSALHIEYNQPIDYDHHIAENKIDASHVTNKLDEGELQKLIGNYSQSAKDKDLSKLIVNELKSGDEIIGDKSIAPISNITFTPENDTLTAMAFIAGNLLSKLWEMEKDAGDDSIETEALKHEKINDLLELFKEPLSIRQETFLKNALEKLSDSLNKNKGVKNVSICETIIGSDMTHGSDETGENDNIRGDKNNKMKCGQPHYKSKEEENQYNITVGLVSKLNNVLGLVKKFESVQKSLKQVKHQQSTEQPNSKYVNDMDKKPSLELFGTVLDKITKLLIPNKSKSKRVTNKLKNLYQFSNKSNVNNIFENKFNIPISKINMTTKDKLVLDYLKHIESNPHCLFRNNIQKNTDNLNTNIEGSILYNLSEFFKIKSFVDLLKVAQPENVSNKPIKSTTEITYAAPNFNMSFRSRILDEEKDPNSTKNKLKSHLKAIVEDLQQLQKEDGVNNIKNVNIMDALPCLYKILNAYQVSNGERSLQRQNITQVTHLDKLKSVLATIKHEFQYNLPTRRNNLIPQALPKSAQIWERMLKNINSLKKNTRRSFMTEKPKTYEQIKNIMETVELMGNTYKNFAIVSEVPPHKRLMLLKTLQADTKQQSIALANIKMSLDTLNHLPLDKRNDIEEFVENVGNNMELSIKVLENIDKTKQINTDKKSEVEVLFTKTNKQALKLPKSLNMPKRIVEYKNNNIKLSRDQILNQLIINRVQLYVKSKEASGADLTDDINYNIGKRILLLIQSRNMTLAKELYRIFIANKQKEERLSQKKDSTMIISRSRKPEPLFLALNEPSMTFNRPERQMQVQTLDSFYKQF